MYDDLAELIAIDSTMGTPSEDAPFGEKPKQALDWFLRKAESYGLRTGNLDNRVGFAEYGEGERLVGILCHADVVPAGEGWTNDPYKLTIEDGKAYGRGVADDKGPLVACLHVMKRLKEENAKLKSRVRLIVGCNEENGSACMKHYRKYGEIPHMSIAPDADFPIINSEKGIWQVLVSIPADEVFRKNVLKLSGGVRSNMVPSHAFALIKKDSPLYAAIASVCGGKPNAKVFSVSPAVENIISAGFRPEDFSIEVTDEWLKLSAAGIAGHAMEPEKGENAVSKLFLFLTSFNEAFPSEAANAASDYLCSPLAAEKLGIACSDEKSGALTLNLGTANYQDGALCFELNIRCPLCADYRTMPEKILSFLPKGSKTETVMYSENLYIDEQSPLVKKLLQVYADCTGQETYTVRTGGGTYARELPNSVAFGPTFPGEETNIHNIDECMEIRHLESLKEIYYRAVIALSEL